MALFTGTCTNCGRIWGRWLSGEWDWSGDLARCHLCPLEQPWHDPTKCWSYTAFLISAGS